MNIAEEHQKIANEVLVIIKPDYTHDDFELLILALNAAFCNGKLVECEERMKK